MAGTFSQLYIQVVFAVKGRQNLIGQTWATTLYQYIAGIVRGKGQKPIIVNGMPDHVHVFIGLRPAMALSDLVRDIKNNSTNFIREKKWVNGKFSWQEGYGAFSYAHSQVRQVYDYILTRSSIIKAKHSGMNTLISCVSMKLNTTPNIYLTGMIEGVFLSPLRGSADVPGIFYNPYTPSGLWIFWQGSNFELTSKARRALILIATKCFKQPNPEGVGYGFV